MGSYIAYAEPTNNYTWSDGTTSKKTINWSIVKANNTLKLSSNSRSYTYPNSGTFSVTTNVSGGDLSCSSNNNSVATCKISGTTVTVIPGTTKGTATITVTSKETANYNSSSVAHVVTTNLGTLSVTASGYNGTYNGSDHSITVTSSGATITYSSDGTNYSSTKPTYRNAGTYTTYYKVSKTGYNTVTGSRTVVINKASGSISLSSTSGEVEVGSSIAVKVNSTTGTLGCSSSNTSIATCSVSGNNITVSGKNLGSATITISAAESTNYNAASATYSISVISLKPCKAVNGNGSSIGDEIVCGTEHFNVISISGQNVTLFAKYNLDAGNHSYKNTGIQMTQYNYDYGMISWDNSGTSDYNNGFIKSYVDEYALYLENNLNINVLESRLLRYKELVSLGLPDGWCDDSVDSVLPSWVYLAPFWMMDSACEAINFECSSEKYWEVMAIVESNGGYYISNEFYVGGSPGIRPVIVIPISMIS